jgi:hypothetical protein
MKPAMVRLVLRGVKKAFSRKRVFIKAAGLKRPGEECAEVGGRLIQVAAAGRKPMIHCQATQQLKYTENP